MSDQRVVLSGLKHLADASSEEAALAIARIMADNPEAAKVAQASAGQEGAAALVRASGIDRELLDEIALGSASRSGQVAGDKILSLEEAAHFVRQASMAPTISEIERAYALGSRRRYLIESIYLAESRREYPAWSPSGQALGGWFGEVAKMLSVPRTNIVSSPVSVPHFDYPGQRYTMMMLLTAFLGNTGLPNAHIEAPSETFRIKASWVLGKILVCSVPGGAWDSTDKTMPIMAWHSILHRYAFKNYADLLEEVTYSLPMSLMLTYMANRKEEYGSQPDENYAREIMQLFTIGLYELNLDGTYKLDDQGRRIPTYDNDDIRQMARVFTGLCRWDYSDSAYTTDNAGIRSVMSQTSQLIGSYGRHFYDDMGAGYLSNTTYQVAAPFVPPRLRHYMPFYDGGAKRALGGHVDIPEGTDPKTNIRMAIDALVSHPNTAPYLSKLLIKHTVTSNPSRGYVARVARVFRDNGRGVAGDLATVWMAILTDPEASNTIHTNPRHGRVRDGFEVYSGIIRPFHRESQIPTAAVDTSSATWLYQVHQTAAVVGVVQESVRGPDYGAWPALAPSIFSYYSPDYSAPPASTWGMVLPEMGAASSAVMMAQLNNLIGTQINNRGPGSGAGEYNARCLDYEPIVGPGYLVAGLDGAQQIVDRLNLLMCGGTLTQQKRIEFASLASALPVSTATERNNRVHLLMQMCAFSTEFMVM